MVHTLFLTDSQNFNPTNIYHLYGIFRITNHFTYCQGLIQLRTIYITLQYTLIYACITVHSHCIAQFIICTIIMHNYADHNVHVYMLHNCWPTSVNNEIDPKNKMATVFLPFHFYTLDALLFLPDCS